jgi:hypothetical protein
MAPETRSDDARSKKRRPKEDADVARQIFRGGLVAPPPNGDGAPQK